MTPARICLPLLALGVLNACGGETKTGPERQTAAGEVLGGSITDDMLPLDTVRSQSPPLREGAAEAEDESSQREGGADPASPQPSRPSPTAAATEEPASPPTPAETPEE